MMRRAKGSGDSACPIHFGVELADPWGNKADLDALPMKCTTHHTGGLQCGNLWQQQRSSSSQRSLPGRRMRNAVRAVLTRPVAAPAPMTNSEVEAARGLDGQTLGVRLPTIRRSSNNPVRPNSSGGGFVDNPTSESNSPRRNTRLENSIGGDTSTSTGGAGARKVSIGPINRHPALGVGQGEVGRKGGSARNVSNARGSGPRANSKRLDILYGCLGSAKAERGPGQVRLACRSSWLRVSRVSSC